MNRSTRGAAPKIPKEASSTSTIRHYMTPDGSSKSPGTTKKVEKTGTNKKGVGGAATPIADISIESEHVAS